MLVPSSNKMAIKLIAAEEELKLEKQKLKEKVLQIEQLTAEAEVQLLVGDDTFPYHLMLIYALIPFIYQCIRRGSFQYELTHCCIMMITHRITLMTMERVVTSVEEKHTRSRPHRLTSPQRTVPVAVQLAPPPRLSRTTLSVALHTSDTIDSLIEEVTTVNVTSRSRSMRRTSPTTHSIWTSS